MEFPVVGHWLELHHAFVEFADDLEVPNIVVIRDHILKGRQDQVDVLYNTLLDVVG